jgi:rhodanese-related sulfurtransferase
MVLPLTAIGIERRLNAKLRHKDRDGFIGEVAQELERPPYFRMMEKLNLEGPPVPGAHHIHITLLPGRLHEIPKCRTIHVFCGSGLRSMTAASLLMAAGWRDVAVILGGLAGWTSRTCPIES